jgi:hypothetical protein
MEAPSLHKKILLISLILIAISILWSIVVLFLFDLEFIFAAIPFFTYSLLAIISSYALNYKHKSWLRKSSRYSLFVFPFVAGLTIYFGDAEEIYSTGFLFLVALCIILMLTSCIHLFLYTKAESLGTISVLLIFLIIGIIFKRFAWPYGGFLITSFSLLIIIGSLIYGIRCLYLAGKNIYFRNVTFYGNFAISLGFSGMMFKFQHWPGGGALSYAGFASLILMTLYILLTLHSSGFIDWPPLFKKVFRKVLIPLTFILLIFISRYMVPELNALLFMPQTKTKERVISPYGFDMKDYEIEDKSGSEPE